MIILCVQKWGLIIFFLLPVISELVRREYKTFHVNLEKTASYCFMSITDGYLELQYMKWIYYFESAGFFCASSMTQSRSGLVLAP